MDHEESEIQKKEKNEPEVKEEEKKEQKKRSLERCYRCQSTQHLIRDCDKRSDFSSLNSSYMYISSSHPYYLPSGCKNSPLVCNAPLSLEDVIQQLLQQKAVIQQLQAEMAAKDQKTKAVEQAFRQEIKALQQRSIYRCEWGTLTIPGYSLSDGSGTRYQDLTATFSRSFSTTPVVTIGLTRIDQNRDLRVDASVIYRYATHMGVRIKTWSDTRLNSARVDWMACA
uniref:H-type lectin domain-containing protein n=1 Tax=Branchiostoma floridae TaxID=7739 RepID=C3XSW7_BRAFL|eukprot:XP_002612826.1 hypothetical protein BRAFLDRAFT_67226 [Branchiostoma floridae]